MLLSCVLYKVNSQINYDRVIRNVRICMGLSVTFVSVNDFSSKKNKYKLLAG